MPRRLVLQLAQRLEELIAFDAEAADPQEIGIRVLHPRRDRAPIAVADIVFKVGDGLDLFRLEHFLSPRGHEERGRIFVRDDSDGLRRIAGAFVGGVEKLRQRLVRVRARQERREMPLVGGHVRHAHGVLDEHLVVALGDAHRGEDRRRAVGAEDEIHLVRGDELLVKRARHVGLRLIVLQHILDRPAQEPAGIVQLLDENLAGQLVHEPGLREGAGERQCLPHLDGISCRGCRPREGTNAQPGDTGHAGQHATPRPTVVVRHFSLPRRLHACSCHAGMGHLREIDPSWQGRLSRRALRASASRVRISRSSPPP